MGEGNVLLATLVLGLLPQGRLPLQLPERQAEVGAARACGVGTGSSLIHESEQLETVEGL